ncbi:SRPBCC family protein [Amycolatopsis aidingensis]|uniref:SRPBCC family protein n=1 Tax=Amycolatopsis aidingensis TaxID=2842453 RepID=UPI001C0B1DD9|nr:SRPBCC domain-containing protein [Amycolatopsis aidingensis]
MADQSLTITFLVDQAPREVFDSITNVRGWWSDGLRGRTEKPGDEFTYRHGDAHRCKIRVTEAIPGRKVSWLVLDNYFDFTEDKTEWIDTTVHFDISSTGGKTEVHFTHKGLVPEYECFEVCSDGWNFFVGSSLRDLITTGRGQPASWATAQVAAD